jgi:nucleotide-binding universal stress UspA family protein
MSRIVVGVDPGAAGRAALDWALREAVSRQLPVHAVRTWMPSAYAVEYMAAVSAELQQQEGAHAQRLVDDELKAAVERVDGAAALTCTTAAVQGAAGHALVDQGKDSAMIVVGTRGHGALSRAVLGSVSASVLHHAKVPVTVVPEPREGDGSPPCVIVGVDHSEQSVAALAAAADQARRRGVPLVPVYVHDPVLTDIAGVGVAAPDPAAMEANERRTLELAAEVAQGVDVQAEVLVGNPGDELKRLARPQDLLVVGSRGRGGFTGLLLGSTSTQLAQHAHCPVLVVR